MTSPTNDNYCNADDLENSNITDESHETHIRQVTIVSAFKAKLHKLTLPKLKGKLTQFHSFWDSYMSVIHTNSDILAIHKFFIKEHNRRVLQLELFRAGLVSIQL